jgi:hypothetical protein
MMPLGKTEIELKNCLPRENTCWKFLRGLFFRKEGKEMKRMNFLQLVAVIWIAVAMLFPILSQADVVNNLKDDSSDSVPAGHIVVWGYTIYDPDDIPVGNDFVAISGAEWYGLALKSDGSLVAWGDNYYGKCDVPEGNDFIAISGRGNLHSLALKSDGSLVAWGNNYDGQCDIPEGNDFVAISAGGSHNLALKTDGSLVAWGGNDDGQCDVLEGNDFVAISAGNRHSLALKSDGSLVAWGDNYDGQCDVPEGNDFVAVSAGGRYSLALKSDGSLVAWGWNFSHQCDVPEGNDFVAVSAGLYHGIALKSDGSLAYWGDDYYGQGDVPEGNNFIAISTAGWRSDLALETEVPQFIDSGIELPGVYDSSVAWGDYDNDGDLDFAICGRISEKLKWISRIYRNNGDNTFTDIGAGLPAGDNGSLAWGDYDNDGDLDLAISVYHIEGGSYWTTRIYKNSGNDTFTNINAGLPGVCYSSLAWGDYDNDGDLDLALCGYPGWDSAKDAPGRITRIYRNNGDNTFTDIGAELPNVLDGSLAWGDYNNDGYLDLAISGTYGYSGTGSDFITRIYRNNGNGGFTYAVGLTGVTDSSLAWGDYDNDGDLDLAVAGWPYSKIYRNNGNGTFTDIKAGLPDVIYGGSLALAWGDYDNDGDLDLAICGRGPITRIYGNNGNGTFTNIGAGLTGLAYSSLAWGDYDNDGDLDLAVCGSPNAGADEPYITKIYNNMEADFDGNNNPNSIPLYPINLTYEQDGTGNVILKWDSGVDEETPEGGLYYNLRVGAAPGAQDVVSGVYGSPLLGNYLRPKVSNDQLGVRLKDLPGSDYYWSVQTIDTGLEVSEWSEEVYMPIIINQPPEIIYLRNYGNIWLVWLGRDKEDGWRLNYSYRVDEGEWSEPSLRRLVRVSDISKGLESGTHLLSVKAIDSKGAESEVKSVEFEVAGSNTPPEIIYLRNYGNIWLVWLGKDKENGYRLNYSYQVDGGKWSKPSPHRLVRVSEISKGLKPGMHIFCVKAIDSEDAESDIKSIKFKVNVSRWWYRRPF